MQKIKYLILFLSFLIISPVRGADIFPVIYYTGGFEPYLEVTLQWNKGEVVWNCDYIRQGDFNRCHSKLEVVVLIHAEEQIVKADKLKISSPETPVPVSFFETFRYMLKPDKYNLTIITTDLMDENPSADTTVISIHAEEPDDHPFLSVPILVSEVDVNCVGDNCKNGMRIQPYASERISANEGRWRFYLEVYIPDGYLDSPLALQYRISGQEEDFIAYKRLKRQKTGAYFLNIPEVFADTGYYKFHASIVNAEREELSKVVLPLKVIDPSPEIIPIIARLPEDTLNFLLRGLTYEVVPEDQGNLKALIRTSDLERKKFFLHNFFRAKYPYDPAGYAAKYYRDLRKIDERFYDGYGYGFESDRGIIYMKYGPPVDIITVEHEQTAPPYEIWFYDHIAESNESDVRFLFYNPTLAIGQFQLLHSNTRLEVQNDQWQTILYEKGADREGFGVEQEDVPDSWNRNALRYFRD